MPTVQANGIDVAYDIHGDEHDAGQTVLLIAGLGEPADTWQYSLLPALLGAGYRVITFDNRGMQPTSCPDGPYTIDQMVDDVAVLVEALEVSPCLVVGYSMGGWIAERLAATRPELVRAVVLMASANDGTSWERLRYRLGLELAASGVELPPLYDVVDILSYLPFDALQDDSVVDTWASLLEGNLSFPNPGRAGQYAAAVEGAGRTDRDDDRKRIECPTLVLAFEFDWDCPPDAQSAAEQLPSATYLEIPGCGHMAPMEKPEVVGRAIVAFLGGV